LPKVTQVPKESADIFKPDEPKLLYSILFSSLLYILAVYILEIREEKVKRKGARGWHPQPLILRPYMLGGGWGLLREER
jgi:hypothetical protein